MGHSEMLLAVAGLDNDQIRQRTESLASGDWSSFTPAEQVALQFAYKLTREARHISDTDVQLLSETFGERRALDLIWYVSWCNYMTRVADAFQLPLEQENVFLEPQLAEGTATTGTSQ
jgi:alkylhydroperoxidase family enzyme